MLQGGNIFGFSFCSTFPFLYMAIAWIHFKEKAEQLKETLRHNNDTFRVISV